jgi:tRNA threonylcarbamoyladenosine biosynthesis protein TsaB
LTTLLLIETSSDVCSVALSVNGKIVSIKESRGEKNHASLVTIYIGEILKQAGVLLNDIDAVAVNAGPGSYTGLRIGLSTAKGLCYALDKPLLLLDALSALYKGALQNLNKEGKKQGHKFICPVIDNRRDEIFYSVFNAEGEKLIPVTLSKTNNEEFLKLKTEKEIFFAGEAKEKLLNITDNKSDFIPVDCSANNLVSIAESKFMERDFANLAYSEPLYYKGVYIQNS